MTHSLAGPRRGVGAFVGFAMRSVPLKSALSPARRRLVEKIQQLHFGRIEGLVVRGGEPVLDPPPRYVREVKCGGDNDPRPEAGASDFRLKQQVVDLLHELDRVGTGTIPLIECKHGLPFRLLVAEPC